jgi:hypothetical protein
LQWPASPVDLLDSHEAGDVPARVMQNSAAAHLPARTLQREGSEDATDKPPFLSNKRKEGLKVFVRKNNHKAQ